ncbi:acid phosphatase type 7 isoform X1 [Chrysoperla carnea]|uniref:acid phosphatase type 7 isoform X1 n=1 Tax=Chrysoperla carnea TaxID=189513 RepID=UPI001D0968DA|nr:acid phosphatase type 7 isoform X1 [Chrysoperla carnea]
MFTFYTIIVLVFLSNYGYSHVSYQPEQIHIAFGESVTEIVVTWSTINDTQQSIVEYGIGGLILRESGSSTKFVDGGTHNRTQYIHRVRLQNLTPETKYVYHVGSDLGWSPKFWFKTVPNENNWSPHLAIYGDMGNVNAKSLAYLQEETQRGLYDAILHVGDFAYDMDWEEGEVGDQFMNQIESIAAYVPYMTCPGNHEQKYNFSHYRARFSMPGGTENLMYSFNLGPVHFISFSTELYYFMNYGLKPLVFQYDWLEKDLIEANKPENRQKRPWIITMGHRPMYCSDNDGDDCTHPGSLVRIGIPFSHFFGLEPLFYKYGVDLEIWAHEHSYERLWPIYDYKIYNGSREESYTNPKAPVHIVTGSAGCQENTDNFIHPSPEWSAFRSSDYGYTKMKVYNRTHLYLEQISVDKLGAVIDNIWLIKEKHGSYSEINDEL